MKKYKEKLKVLKCVSCGKTPKAKTTIGCCSIEITKPTIKETVERWNEHNSESILVMSTGDFNLYKNENGYYWKSETSGSLSWGNFKNKSDAIEHMNNFLDSF